MKKKVLIFVALAVLAACLFSQNAGSAEPTACGLEKGAYVQVVMPPEEGCERELYGQVIRSSDSFLITQMLDLTWGRWEWEEEKIQVLTTSSCKVRLSDTDEPNGALYSNAEGGQIIFIPEIKTYIKGMNYVKRSPYLGNPGFKPLADAEKERGKNQKKDKLHVIVCEKCKRHNR